MASKNVKVDGLKEVMAKFEKLGGKAFDAFRWAVYAEGLHIIRKATAEAPAVTGRLRNSHFVTWPDRRGTVEIGFATKYAASVEYGIRIVEMNRQRQKAAFANMRESGWKKSAVGGPGFFRGAINSTSAGRAQRIANTARRYFEGGFPGAPDQSMPKSSKQRKGK